jgi:hypothetical protein
VILVNVEVPGCNLAIHNDVLTVQVAGAGAQVSHDISRTKIQRVKYLSFGLKPSQGLRLSMISWRAP